MIYSIDFESSYSKEVSIKVQGYYHYLRHPWCEVYLVSVVGDDGFTFVGHPTECPWERLSGHTWLHHNAGFEDEVIKYLKEIHVIPETCIPKEVFCTADMAAYLGVPRDLASACKELLKVELDKGPRDRAKNKQWYEMTPDFQQIMIRYALDDARRPLELWQAHSAEWPEWERRFSTLTRRMSQRGVLIDREKIERYVGNLERLFWAANRAIPWSDTHAALSYKKLCEECRKAGIRPPASTALDSEDCAAWEEEFGDRFPWVDAMRTKRRANTMLKKFKKVRDRIRPDGRASLPVKYCGCSTRRGSGDAGTNAQNMNRDSALGEEMVRYGVVDGDPAHAGVYLRECIIAPPGKKIVAVDKAQIEPRVLAFLAGDTEKLKLLHDFDIYELHARQTMGYDRPEKLKSLTSDPYYDKLRRLAKARELGLGFYCGADKFVVVAWTLAQLRITQQEAEFAVKDYRAKNPKVTRLWRRMQKMLEASVGQDLIIVLPSGNKLVYKNVACRDGDYTALICKHEKMLRLKIHSGILTENLVQACARDMFALDLLRIDGPDAELILQTHDEGVAECPEERNITELETLMNVAPDWMPGIPLESEACEGPNYSFPEIADL